jgi:hypothetical protein
MAASGNGHHRLAVYTTVYPGCERFLPDWYASVLAQTDQRFDLWISLDALTMQQVEAASGRSLSAAQFVAANPGDTPADVRERALEKLIACYDAIVFVDADDLLHPTRVEAAREALATSDLCGCALHLADEAGTHLGIPFGAPPHGADLAGLLPRYNVFGLSNSAYRSATLARCLPLPSACVLIDWLLASRAAASGAVLGFDDVPRMVYRRHDHNCAPVLPPFTPRQVLTAASLLVQHYACLLDSDWHWRKGYRQPFERARLRARLFHDAMQSSSDRLHRYVKALNDLPPQYVWWWAVGHPALEDLWTVCT